MKCPIFAGWVYDVTNYYPGSFFLGGGAAVLASLMMIRVKKFSQKTERPKPDCPEVVKTSERSSSPGEEREHVYHVCVIKVD